MLNFRRSLVLASLLLFGYLVAGRAQDVVIASGDRPSDHGWTSGTLQLRFQNTRGQSESVRVTFSGQPVGRLDALQVQAGDWQLDLSFYVTSLPVVFPHRIQISTELADDGIFHELVLDLPYRNSLGSCMTLELLISDGRVIDDESLEVLSEHCAQ